MLQGYDYVDCGNIIHDLCYGGSLFKCNPCDYEKSCRIMFARLFRFPEKVYEMFVVKNVKYGYCVACRMKCDRRSLCLCANCVNALFNTKGNLCFSLVKTENRYVNWEFVDIFGNVVISHVSSLNSTYYVMARRCRLIDRFYKKSIMLFLMGRFDDGSILIRLPFDIIMVILGFVY